MKENVVVIVSQSAPEKSAWCSCVPRTVALHKKGRRREMHEYRGAAGSETSISQISPSTRVRRGWKREWEAQHPRKNPLHNPATEARRGQRFCTWDIPARWLPCRCGVPSCGSRGRGRSWGTPKAASLPPHLYGWCWEKLKCLSRRDTAAWRRLSPVAGLRCVSESGRGTVRPPFSTGGWLRTGRWENHPGGHWSHFLPVGGTQKELSLRAFTDNWVSSVNLSPASPNCYPP